MAFESSALTNICISRTFYLPLQKPIFKIMRNTKTAKATVEASKKGYLVDGSGKVWYKGKLVSGYKKPRSGTCYMTITIRDLSGKSATISVHQLHAYQKYGEKALGDDVVVRHLNGDSLDNSWGNIAIGSMSQNMMDRPSGERKFYSLIAASHQVKYDAEAIRKDHEDGLSYRDIMIKYGISSKGTVSHIINKRQIMKPLQEVETANQQ
jgi:Mor family transcriptional regulator